MEKTKTEWGIERSRGSGGLKILNRMVGARLTEKEAFDKDRSSRTRLSLWSPLYGAAYGGEREGAEIKLVISFPQLVLQVERCAGACGMKEKMNRRCVSVSSTPPCLIMAEDGELAETRGVSCICASQSVAFCPSDTAMLPAMSCLPSTCSNTQWF